MEQTTESQMQRNVLTISAERLEELLEKEWLLTNERGSYSSSTVLACNTRRYHGLLVASLQPPVQRIVTLSGMLETIHWGNQNCELANFEFSDRLHPQGYRFLKEFRRDAGVHFIYELEGLAVEKSLYLAHNQDILVINYDFSGSIEQGKLELMPLVALRDFHSLQSSAASLSMDYNEGVYTAHVLDPHGPAVHFHCPQAHFDCGPDWWYAMHYRQEQRRGQQDYEDVWAPGCFHIDFQCPGRITLVVQATAGLQRPGPLNIEVDDLVTKLRRREEELFTRADVRDEQDKRLARAADQFIVRRWVNESHLSTSILAGYHWFADWGRDALIALPGLLLETGRFDEAREVLLTFGSALNEGMIPNFFGDYGNQVHYNSVDASLWYVNTAYRYLLATDDEPTFRQHFLPVIEQIAEAYHKGTRFNIHADEDGLISAGDPETQLTWMDARCNGVSFTPRHGKPVEINALWINTLRILAETVSSSDGRRCYLQMAQTAEESFRRQFWNEQGGYLYDCITPDGVGDGSIRPNQIFAVSLPYCCLPHEQQSSVVQVVQEHLLTSSGLRSLSPRDNRYHRHYQGDQFQRDSAYHQGTVWAFLMGPFVEAFLRINQFSDQAKRQASEIISPLLEHLDQDGCLGSISEIFDGDFPHWPKGCIAQAWSVAELIRCKRMLR